MIPNSQEAELKRRRTALEGKIRRRNASIDRMRDELYLAERELRIVERELEAYRPEPRRGRG